MIIYCHLWEDYKIHTSIYQWPTRSASTCQLFWFSFFAGHVAEKRSQRLDRGHILDVKEKADAADKWETIAERMPNYNENPPGYAFDDEDIRQMKKDHDNNGRSCLKVVLTRWAAMSSEHTIGVLYDLLRQLNLGSVAVDVFGKLHDH